MQNNQEIQNFPIVMQHLYKNEFDWMITHHLEHFCICAEVNFDILKSFFSRFSQQLHYNIDDRLCFQILPASIEYLMDCKYPFTGSADASPVN